MTARRGGSTGNDLLFGPADRCGGAEMETLAAASAWRPPRRGDVLGHDVPQDRSRTACACTIITRATTAGSLKLDRSVNSELRYCGVFSDFSGGGSILGPSYRDTFRRGFKFQLRIIPEPILRKLFSTAHGS